MRNLIYITTLFLLYSCSFSVSPIGETGETDGETTGSSDASVYFDSETLYDMADNDPVSTGSTYYIDPENGSMANDGSIDSPWSTLEEVIDANLIEHYEYEVKPYIEGGAKKIVNSGAPITGGDTLVLLSGDHGSLAVRGYYFNDYLTIKAAEGSTPVLSKVDLVSVSKIYIKGITVKQEPDADPTVDVSLPGYLIFIESHGWHGEASYVTIDDCTVTSEGDWENWDEEDWIAYTTGGIQSLGEWVVIKNCLLENVANGIIASKNNIIRNNVINRFRRDGMLGCSDNAIFENNTVLNAYDVDDNHDDCFQSYTTDNNAVVNNIIFRGNHLQPTTDASRDMISTAHGMGCFGGPYEGWIIEDNTIAIDHLHGITLMGAHNSVVRNNLVVPLFPDNPNIMAAIRMVETDEGEALINTSVTDNVSFSYQLDPAIYVSGNTTLTKSEELESLFVDYKNLDFTPK